MEELRCLSSFARSDEEIWNCIKEVKSDSRYKKIMIDWAVSHGGFSENVLFKGRIEI